MDSIADVLGCDDGALRRGDSEATDKASSLKIFRSSECDVP